MRYPGPVWNQLKNKKCDELIRALGRDGWQREYRKGSMQLFRHPDGRKVTIHYHPHKTYGPKQLKGILSDTRWTVDEMRALKLIR